MQCYIYIVGVWVYVKDLKLLISHQTKSVHHQSVLQHLSSTILTTKWPSIESVSIIVINSDFQNERKKNIQNDKVKRRGGGRRWENTSEIENRKIFTQLWLKIGLCFDFIHKTNKYYLSNIIFFNIFHSNGLTVLSFIEHIVQRMHKDWMTSRMDLSILNGMTKKRFFLNETEQKNCEIKIQMMGK